jgi:hypothetical protein
MTLHAPFGLLLAAALLLRFIAAAVVPPSSSSSSSSIEAPPTLVSDAAIAAGAIVPLLIVPRTDVHAMTLNPDALRFLSSQSQLVFVSALGVMRSGKSFLLEQLAAVALADGGIVTPAAAAAASPAANASTHFYVGHTVFPGTKSVEMAVLGKDARGATVVLLGEGFESAARVGWRHRHPPMCGPARPVPALVHRCSESCSVASCRVVWRRVAWCGVVWRGVVSCGVLL